MHEQNNIPVDLEAIRQAHIQKISENAAEVKPRMGLDINRLTEVIEANKGHIAGIAVVIIPEYGDALVDPEPKRAMDGLSTLMALNTYYREVVLRYLREIIDENSGQKPGMPHMGMIAGSLQDLFKRLQEGDDQ